LIPQGGLQDGEGAHEWIFVRPLPHSDKQLTG
jgi:hypothetical protein